MNTKPKCDRRDCRFTIQNTVKTTAFYPDSTQDLNTTSGQMKCSSCKRLWSFEQNYQGTKYKELL
jgi:hypothetical protein